jgi:hypothetical protein
VRDPLILPLIAFAAGILLSHGARFERGELLLPLLLLFTLFLIALHYCRRLALAACLVATCCAGIFVDVLHRPLSTPSVDADSRETLLVSGCVVDPPIFYESRDQFTVQLAPHASARTSLTVRDGESPPELFYGQLLNSKPSSARSETLRTRDHSTSPLILLGATFSGMLQYAREHR